jgi:HPt (histidine-containing phosphotransfer) domain-containing protein
MTTGPASAPEWIDHAALRRLLDILGNDPDEFAELMSDYLVDAPDLVRRMLRAVEKGDREAFRIAAHTLKSNARDVGAAHLSKLCATAEAAVSSPATSADLAALAGEIARAEQAARQALSEVDPAELASREDKE